MTQEYKKYFSDRKFLKSAGFALIFLLISLVANFYAGIYATEIASNSVTDLILSNIGTVDLDGVFVYGTIIFWIFAAFIIFKKPKRIPFTLASVALFTVIRSVFISLTHIGPYPTQVAINSYILSFFVFGADLFFSGHTGLPYLLSLIFWDIKKLRYTFLILSFVFAAIVLLGHMHYSIDVLAAYFITYAIYHLAGIFFKKDKEFFEKGMV